MTYQELYTCYRNLVWTSGMFPEISLARKFQDQYQADLTRIHKEMYPRRRIVRFGSLPQETIDTTRAKWQERALIWFTCALGRVKWLKRTLNRMALETPIAEEAERVAYRSGSHHTQGYGADKYSRIEAENWAAPLIAEGWPVEIQKGSYGYEVRCTLPDWGCDVVRRRSTQSVMDWAIGCWKRGVNPKVFNPFLNDEIFEKSCDIAMKGVQNDTANM